MSNRNFHRQNTVIYKSFGIHANCKSCKFCLSTSVTWLFMKTCLVSNLSLIKNLNMICLVAIFLSVRKYFHYYLWALLPENSLRMINITVCNRKKEKTNQFFLRPPNICKSQEPNLNQATKNKIPHSASDSRYLSSD